MGQFRVLFHHYIVPIALYSVLKRSNREGGKGWIERRETIGKGGGEGG